MSPKRSNPNKPFMIVNGILAVAVFAVVCLFLYISFKFKRDADKIVTYEGQYRIELSESLAGEDLSIYLNDSLLHNGVISDTCLIFYVNRFAEENMLMIVDNTTDNATPFNLKPKGSRVEVKKQEGNISIIEQEEK